MTCPPQKAAVEEKFPVVIRWPLVEIRPYNRFEFGSWNGKFIPILIPQGPTKGMWLI